MPELFAGRFTPTNSGVHLTGGVMAEAFERPSRIGIRWNIEGYGIERIEVTVKARGRLDQYNRMNNHLGGAGVYTPRLAIFDSYVYNCVSGFVTGVRPEGTHAVTYIAKGVGWNHRDQYGPTTTLTPTDTTSEQLIEFLTDDVYMLSDDFSNIEETSTPLGGWQPPPKFGMYPAEFIEFARKAANSNGELWDYYCIDRPMNFGNLRDFTAYFRNRANRTTADWRVSINDLKRLDMSREISDFRSSAIIWYGTYQDTATGGSSTTLVDSGATFLDGRFSVGDEVKNLDDGCIGRIREIASNTQLNLTTLSGGTANAFANGDDYSITSDTLWNFEDESYASFNTINRRIAEHRPEFDSTQADQYANALHGFYGVPVQNSAFVVTSPFIRDGNGAKRPLWEPIFQGGGVIQVDDLYPAAAVSLNQATNNLDTFFITAMDYDYSTNQLRVALNVPDSRLDAKLKMAGIIGGEMIARGG